jgi:kynurenine formamidase
VGDVQAALQRITYTIRPRDIVLIQTGSDRWLGTPEYFTRGCGMSAEATRWILEQGVKVTGVDAWSWDGPLQPAAHRAKRTGQRDVFWAGHFVGCEQEYCHLERLANLDQLPPTGLTVCCFPLKVAGGSAGPARVVAILDA